MKTFLGALVCCAVLSMASMAADPQAGARAAVAVALASTPTTAAAAAAAPRLTAPACDCGCVDGGPCLCAACLADYAWHCSPSGDCVLFCGGQQMGILTGGIYRPLIRSSKIWGAPCDPPIDPPALSMARSSTTTRAAPACRS